MSPKNVAIATLVLIIAILLIRDSDAGPQPTGRYQISGTNATMWRVDTITGAMRSCHHLTHNGRRMYRCFDVE
ncbi:MAG: hypothetical protein R3C70_12075 [Geminicoccaceae bacterium]|nr:hypothetical protein [Geminicoccaceae bacterium]